MSTPTTQPVRIAVTGGRGRLATLLADHFRAPAHDVALFSSHIALFSRAGGLGFRPLADLSAALPTVNVVLHLAWSTLPATSESGRGTEWQNDLPALEALLQAAAALPPAQRPHFIFFSTGGAVYGDAPGRPSVETDTCRPIGWYGKAKRAAEELIERYAAQHGLPSAILRISNPYGYPVPRSRLQGIIPHAIRCAVEGQTLNLWGDGQARKDFIYYRDFLSVLEQVIDLRLTGIYNIAAGESHTVREVIALVEEHTERKIDLSFQPVATWDVQDSRLDNRRIVAATGWRPQVSLTEGIRRSASGFLDR
jgi:UDP-glucose 4-epimerase